MGKIGGLIDIDFSARKGQRDQWERRLREERARAPVATEGAQIRKGFAGEDGGNAQNARVG